MEPSLNNRLTSEVTHLCDVLRTRAGHQTVLDHIDNIERNSQINILNRVYDVCVVIRMVDEHLMDDHASSEMARSGSLPTLSCYASLVWT